MKKTSTFTKVITALLMLSMLLACFSCDIMKKSQKSKIDEESSINENNTSSTGSSLDFKSKRWELQPLDTNRPITFGGKTLENMKVVYVETEGKKEEKKEEKQVKNQEYSKDIVEKHKEKKEEFDSSVILYILLSFIFIFIVIIILIFIVYKSNKKMNMILSNLLK